MCLARFNKGGLAFNPNHGFKQPGLSNPQQRKREVWRKKYLKGCKELSNHMKQDPLRAIKGEVNDTFMEWLSRSLICVSNEPLDLEMLSKLLAKDGCSKLYALSKYQFILTFDTINEMEVSLANREELDKWFFDVKKWDRYEVSDNRRVWIEVFGVPPHGWTQLTFERIASNWGKLVWLETPIEDTISFKSMRILINSGSTQKIEGHLILHLADAGYRVEIKEASCFIQVNPQFIVPNGSSSMEVKVHNRDTKNAEVHENDVAINDEVVSTHWPKINRLEVDASEEAGREIQNFEIEDVAGQHVLRSRNSPSGNSKSSFMTMIAQFSQNGIFEEIAKLSQKDGGSQYVEKNENVVNWVDDQAKCIGNEEWPSPNTQKNEP